MKVCEDTTATAELYISDVRQFNIGFRRVSVEQ